MQHRFLLTDRANGALDPVAALDFVSDPGFGGITMFVGKVRDLNHDRQVLGVSYDIFEPLALVRFGTIAAETERASGTPSIRAPSSTRNPRNRLPPRTA